MSDFVRSVTVSIIDASSTALTINYGTLTGGTWETPPDSGSTISPGNRNDYVNGVSNHFESLGGTILLTPASGGQITTTWSWPNGSPVSGSATTTAVTGFTVTSSWTNTNTNFPHLIVLIANAKTVETFIQHAMSEAKA